MNVYCQRQEVISNVYFHPFTFFFCFFFVTVVWRRGRYFARHVFLISRHVARHVLIQSYIDDLCIFPGIGLVCFSADFIYNAPAGVTCTCLSIWETVLVSFSLSCGGMGPYYMNSLGWLDRVCIKTTWVRD